MVRSIVSVLLAGAVATFLCSILSDFLVDGPAWTSSVARFQCLRATGELRTGL